MQVSSLSESEVCSQPEEDAPAPARKNAMTSEAARIVATTLLVNARNEVVRIQCGTGTNRRHRSRESGRIIKQDNPASNGRHSERRGRHLWDLRL